MGKHSIRNDCKRSLEQSRGNISWAIDHLKWIPPVYNELHPEISNPVEEVIAALLALDIIISQINETV